MTKRKLKREITKKTEYFGSRILSLINQVDDRDSLIENLKYQISQSEEEIEFYRDMYINSESDFQDLRTKYMQLKKTVIKEFKRNQSLKSKNDCLAYNFNRALHDKSRVEKENRKQSMKIRELMILKKQLILYVRGLRNKYIGLGIIGEDPTKV